MADEAQGGHAEDELDDILDSALDDFAKASMRQTPSAEASPNSQPQEAAAPRPAGGGSGPSRPECDVPVTGSGREVESLGPVKGLGMPPLGGKKRRSKKGKEPAAPGTSSSSCGTPSGASSARRTGAATGASSAAGGGGAVGRSSGDGGSRPRRQPKDLNATLEQLAAQTRQTVEGLRAAEEPVPAPTLEDDGAGPGSAEEVEMMEKLVKQFEEMGTQDIQGLMDTMLQQLLSRDVLHEPMVEIRDRYPAWLAANSAKLSPEDVGRYSRQYESIQRLCQLYDTRPEDFSAILAVMKEMQECGQPPADIIQGLAPGLEIGEDGLPVIPDLGSGDLPANCCVM